MGTGRCVTEVTPRGLVGWVSKIADILMKNTSDMLSHSLKKLGVYLNKPLFYSRLQFDISAPHKAMDNISPQNLSYLIHQA